MYILQLHVEGKKPLIIYIGPTYIYYIEKHKKINFIQLSDKNRCINKKKTKKQNKKFIFHNLVWKKKEYMQPSTAQFVLYAVY